MIIFQKYITRAQVREHNGSRVYLFGDNLARRGYGGQAGAMRGEPNAIGIPTKHKPTNTIDAFFTDQDFDLAKREIDIDFAMVKVQMQLGLDVVVPSDGLGTGLAKLDRTAPKIFAYIQDKIEELKTTVAGQSGG